MRALLFIYCSLCFYYKGVSQSGTVYDSLIARASLSHLQQDYKTAITLYEEAEKIHHLDALTYYKAAGMYSLNGDADNAFRCLALSLSCGWTEADWLEVDEYFDYLRESYPLEWRRIEEMASAAERQYEKTLRLPQLRREIIFLTLGDQKLRYQKIHEANDSASAAINRQIAELDARNLIKAKQIVQRYGWPKIAEIGRDGQNNLWLIVQHADSDVRFQQVVLRAMQKMKGSKEINLENYAFLYDRVQCNLNYKQRYGTQVNWTTGGKASSFRPIADEYNINKVREEFNLKALEIYALEYGFNYRSISREQSDKNDADYQAHVRSLTDSAKQCYKNGDFARTYDFYNNASTFPGGMSNEDNLEAAVIFSTISLVNGDEKYKSIALDFLELLSLRGCLTRKALEKQAAFTVLAKESRWIQINNTLH